MIDLRNTVSRRRFLGGSGPRQWRRRSRCLHAFGGRNDTGSGLRCATRERGPGDARPERDLAKPNPEQRRDRARS